MSRPCAKDESSQSSDRMGPVVPHPNRGFDSLCDSKQRILDGHLLPGAPLRERVLSAAAGGLRHSMHEAAERLTGDLEKA
jgi:hypothetical protein